MEHVRHLAMDVVVHVLDVVKHVIIYVRINVAKVAERAVPVAVMDSVKVDVGKHVPDLQLKNMIHVKSHVPENVMVVVALQRVALVQDAQMHVRVDVRILIQHQLHLHQHHVLVAVVLNHVAPYVSHHPVIMVAEAEAQYLVVAVDARHRVVVSHVPAVVKTVVLDVLVGALDVPVVVRVDVRVHAIKHVLMHVRITHIAHQEIIITPQILTVIKVIRRSNG